MAKVVDEEAGVDFHESLRVAQTENPLTSLTSGKQDQVLVKFLAVSSWWHAEEKKEKDQEEPCRC